MSELSPESFGMLLREKLAELDVDEACHVIVDDDPVERLRLDARQAVLAEGSGPMPRSGHQVYAPLPPATDAPRARHLNLLR